MADMILRAEGICKKYKRPTKTESHFEAVKPLDFLMQKGKMAAIYGRSGSGKSSLLYMMAGLLKPNSGRVFAEGFDDFARIRGGETKNSGAAAESGEEKIDLYALDDERLSRFRNKHFGVIPQGQTGLYSLTVLQNVLVPACIYKESGADEKKAKELLELVGIGRLSSARMNELSGGEMRRMAVARALVSDCDFIFADEPTDDLDDENTKIVLALLRKIADSGKAVLLVSHESSAKNYADEVYRMNSGSITRES